MNFHPSTRRSHSSSRFRSESEGKRTIIHKGASSTRNFIILHALSAPIHPPRAIPRCTLTSPLTLTTVNPLSLSLSPFDENKLNFRACRYVTAKIDFPRLESYAKYTFAGFQSVSATLCIYRLLFKNSSLREIEKSRNPMEIN